MKIHKHLKNFRLIHFLLGLFWLFAFGVFWFTMAPQQLGGRFLYVIVTGNSMEPFLRDGDLTLVNPRDTYTIGDVVVYQHPKLGAVIHRIVAIEGDRFVIQGDHNDWIDSYRPTRAEILGKLWFHLAYTGKVIDGFRTPIGAALLAGTIGLILFWPDRKLQEAR